MRICVIDDDQRFLCEFKKIYSEQLFSYTHNEENELVLSQTMLDFDELKSFDIIFIDIILKDINTIELLSNEYRTLDSLIVFISSNNDLVFDALKVDPLTFLRKSHFEDDFDFFVRTYIGKIANKKVVKLPIGDIEIAKIQYINACGHDLTIVTSQKEYRFYGSLKKVLNDLNDYRFVRVQKSVCINLGYIYDMNKDKIILKSGQEINISRYYKDSVRKAYYRFLLHDNV